MLDLYGSRFTWYDLQTLLGLVELKLTKRHLHISRIKIVVMLIPIKLRILDFIIFIGNVLFPFDSGAGNDSRIFLRHYKEKAFFLKIS